MKIDDPMNNRRQTNFELRDDDDEIDLEQFFVQWSLEIEISNNDEKKKDIFIGIGIHYLKRN